MKLKAWLETFDISPTAFAAEMGVQPSTVTRWVNEERKPRVEALIAIERLTKGRVTMNDFAADEPTKEPAQ